jgi:3,4-dihydroxyphenylacetate 2,3-dioxygenase
MTLVEELVAAPVAAPPYDILRAAYVELVVTDLERAERFYVGALGMIVGERDADALYLRGWEERQHHSLVLRRGTTAAAGAIGFRVRGEGDLDALAEEFAGRGCVTRWSDGERPGLGRVLHAWDPFGFPLEFVHALEQVPSQLQRFHLQRGAPILRIDHFNLHSPDVEGTFAFWRELGFRCSEYIATDGEDDRLTGAWLMRKAGVHDVALTAGRGPRLHHFGVWVGEPAGVLRACDQLAAAGHVEAIERGPGRHGVSNAFFVYLRDPDGHRIELYSCDYYTGDPDHAPLRWSVSDPRCRSFWGTKAPDSWYEESTPVLGPDGNPAQTIEAGVDERDARTEVLA